ncbi:MAG: MFS transporter, partial [Steroidobacteraceae bacterium]
MNSIRAAASESATDVPRESVDDETQLNPVRAARVALVLLTLTNLVNYIDRMLMPALAQPIKQEFGLSDAQVGILTGFAFALVYAIAGIPIARLADRSVRRTILAVSLAFWSVMTAMCGLVKSFGQLALARVGVGIGEAGCLPSSYSLLSDYFPPERRGVAIGWFVVGNCLGITVGFMLGGWLGAQVGWRNAFLIVGLPGLLLAIAIRVFVREPPRSSGSGVDAQPDLRQTLKLLLRNRSYRWSIAGNVAFTFVIHGTVAWLPAFFMRSHEASLATAGAWTGIVVGIGMAVGTLAGGVWGDRLVRRGLERPQLLCIGAMMTLALGYLVVFWVGSMVVAFVAAFIACAVGALAASPNPTTILNVTESRVRATAAAVNVMLCSLFGIGLAPVLIGLLSDLLTPVMDTEALRYALTAVVPACLIA